MDIGKMREKFNGLTYDDVINEGNRIQKLIDEKNKEQARIEIEELYLSKANSKRDSLNLLKFKVEKSRFYKRKTFFMEEPVISLSVMNGTEEPISRAYFKGVLMSLDRSIPWLVEDFNYEINTSGISNISVPPMLLQPLLENALKHGLLHKMSDRYLKVHFQMDGILKCTIIDNGVGRKASSEINNRRNKNHKSYQYYNNQIKYDACKVSIFF